MKLEFGTPMMEKAKGHNCPYCHGKKTVHWMKDTWTWTCSACGRVDVSRARKTRKCYKI